MDPPPYVPVCGVIVSTLEGHLHVVARMRLGIPIAGGRKEYSYESGCVCNPYKFDHPVPLAIKKSIDTLGCDYLKDCACPIVG